MAEKYLYLLLTIICTTLMMTAVKEASRRGMDLLQAITFNYYTCVIIGLCFSPKAFTHVFVDHPEVIPLVIFLGSCFILTFLLIGEVTKRGGIAYMAFISKIAVVISVLYSWKYFDDPLTTQNVIGIVLALGSVALINYRKGTSTSFDSAQDKSLSNQTGRGRGAGSGILILLSLLLFLGSGISDCTLKYFSAVLGDKISDADFAICVFAVAGTLGFTGVCIRAIAKKSPFKWRNIGGGIGIGLPNYFSLVFLTMGLQKLDGTIFFPVNNFGILVCAALVGLGFYKEKINTMNIIGMTIAVISIVLMVI